MLPGLLLKSRLLRARFHTRDYMVGAIVHFLHTFFWLTDAHAPVASERGLRACPIHLACPNRCPAMHEEPSLVLYGGVPAWTSLERLPAAQAACPPAVLAVGRLGQRLSLQTRKLTWGMCFLFLLSRKLTAGPDVRVCTLRPCRSDPAGPPYHHTCLRTYEARVLARAAASPGHRMRFVSTRHQSCYGASTRKIRPSSQIKYDMELKACYMPRTSQPELRGAPRPSRPPTPPAAP